MFNLQKSLIVCSFLSLFVHYVTLLQRLVETATSICVKNLRPKGARRPLSQTQRVLMSSIA